MKVTRSARGIVRNEKCYHNLSAATIAPFTWIDMAHFNSPLDMAKTQVALRALRYGHFPADIFDEYAWDMMLHMYIAALREQTIYVDNVVNLTSKNKLVGDRWIAHLIREEMVALDGDKVKLTEDCFMKMNEYHTHALNLLEN